MPSTTDVQALHKRATDLAKGIIDRIPPDRMTTPTPCTKWDVRR